MDWHKLLCHLHLEGDGNPEKTNRPSYVQDADRITFSTPFRRLANKTQVHPLYDHDHLHHRMIHSVETASVGKSLGMHIGEWLKDQNYTKEDERHRISGIIHAACLAHDIGNPPFGHSGEAAIGEWFSEKFSNENEILKDIPLNNRPEFIKFEGNAQGFRLLTRLEMYRNKGGMRLSNSVLASFTKYPTTANVSENIKKNGSEVYCGLKKFNIFHSEYDIFLKVAEKTGIPEIKTENNEIYWKRHPLAFLVEAADDICYNIIDLEDAYMSGDVDYQTVHDIISEIAKPKKYNESESKFERIAHLRALAIGEAISACVNAFKENYQSIMDGSFNHSLVNASVEGDNFKEIKKVSFDRLFRSTRKTELEILGRNTVHKVMNALLELMIDLKKEDWQLKELKKYHKQLCDATGIDLRDVNDSYSALHAMTDYVSGMTDRYAIKISKMISG